MLIVHVVRLGAGPDLSSTVPGKRSDVEGRDLGPVRYTTASEHGSVI
jgi:hypothetical protein